MVANIPPCDQVAIKPIENNFLRVIRWSTYNYFNIILSKKLLGTHSHAAGYNHIYLVFMEPFWQYTWFMRRWYRVFFTNNSFCFLINFDNNKFFAMTEMHAKFTFCSWNGNFHISDRKSTRLNSSHVRISYAVFC